MKKKGSSAILLPKVYESAAISKGQEYYDYQNHTFTTNTVQNYACSRKVGRGKYSEVFQSVNLLNSEKCIIKVLKPITSKKIKREIKILQAVSGNSNCIKLYDIIQEDDITCLVFQHVENIDFKQFVTTLSLEDCQYYLYQILLGLDYCHSMGIMHRDIKPQNVMIDPMQRKVRIIDWGLAEFYLPQKDYNVRVSSRYYKGPQLLTDYEYYHYSLDIWSLGVMMAEMIFKKDHIFKGSDNFDQLHQITRVLGTKELYEYVEDYEITLSSQLRSVLKEQAGMPLKSFINEFNKELATNEAIDLVSKMLKYDHNKRPTARQCMQHPYFSKIHKK